MKNINLEIVEKGHYSDAGAMWAALSCPLCKSRELQPMLLTVQFGFIDDNCVLSCICDRCYEPTTYHYTVPAETMDASAVNAPTPEGFTVPGKGLDSKASD